MDRRQFVSICILLFSITQTEKSYSQLLPFHYYTTADGLPTNQFSHIHLKMSTLKSDTTIKANV